jgi:sensor histidine kinase regulating citrate/malate metabolism
MDYRVIAGLLILAVPAAVFAVRRYLTVLVDRRIAAYQNDLVLKHYDEVRNIYTQMRGWRHDYHNHIQAMKVFLTLKQEAEHFEYLNKLDEDLTGVDVVLKTGNVMVDAILNSKISLAKSREIKINAKASVPSPLAFSEIDLCVIIGNLFDNAMEACAKIPDAERRFIRVFIGRHNQMLYISFTNSTHNRVKRDGRSFRSTKGSASHGFGLMRVDRITGKYGGFVNRQAEDGVFATEIMLPMKGTNNSVPLLL